MSPVLRRIGVVAGVLAVSAALVVGAGVLVGPPDDDSARLSASSPSGSSAGTDSLTRSIAATQERLRRIPLDWQGWAALGAAYVEQARQSADPTFYDKAAGALQKSLEIHAEDNSPALTGLAALAAARHDFALALATADRSLAINDFNAPTHGIRGDALIELGRYDEGIAAFQRMVDLRPGTSSYARASYSWELRGNIVEAVRAMELAREASSAPADVAFATYHLGELAFGAGDLATAERHFTEGIQRDAGSILLRAGLAKLSAAKGNTQDALKQYATVVNALPQTSYLVEYGELLESIGRPEEAQTQYDVVRTVQQLFAAQGVSVDQELALFEADHGDPAAALRAAEQVWTQQKGAVFVEDVYAWALHANGRYREALIHADAALRLGTRSALLYFHRGMIEAALGLRDRARADLSKALEINPHFSPRHAPVARKTLATLGTAP